MNTPSNVPSFLERLSLNNTAVSSSAISIVNVVFVKLLLANFGGKNLKWHLKHKIHRRPSAASARMFLTKRLIDWVYVINLAMHKKGMLQFHCKRHLSLKVKLIRSLILFRITSLSATPRGLNF